MSGRNQLLLNFPVEEKYDFNSFITGRNQEVLAQLKDLQNCTQHFHFLWGESGCGKSHLLQAVCRNNPQSVYIPLKLAVEGTPELLETLDDFRLVCLDDLQSILGNEAWEVRLFSLFNQIREGGGRLVVSAGGPPKTLAVNLPDLASRLAWGTVYRLWELDDGDKSRALKYRAHLRGFELSDEVLKYLMLRNSRDMHALFDVLERMDQLSLREKRRITVPFLKNIMPL